MENCLASPDSLRCSDVDEMRYLVRIKIYLFVCLFYKQGPKRFVVHVGNSFFWFSPGFLQTSHEWESPTFAFHLMALLKLL